MIMVAQMVSMYWSMVHTLSNYNVGIYLPTQVHKAAIVGFHDNHFGKSLELSYSGTFYIHRLTTGSNVGKEGLYIYKIDGSEIVGMNYTYIYN